MRDRNASQRARPSASEARPSSPVLAKTIALMASSRTFVVVFFGTMIVLVALSVTVGEGSGAEQGKLTAEDEVLVFRDRLKDIRNLIDQIDADFLKPWKINQNISVSVQDNGMGRSCMRVRILLCSSARVYFTHTNTSTCSHTPYATTNT
jgi:hypothetical protein